MSTPVQFDQLCFRPQNGGDGVRISCSTTSANAQVPSTDRQTPWRIAVSNSGSVSAFVKLSSSSGVVATTASYEIMPGSKEILTPPPFATALYIAAITESGTTSISACLGTGA